MSSITLNSFSFILNDDDSCYNSIERKESQLLIKQVLDTICTDSLSILQQFYYLIRIKISYSQIKT